VQIEIFRSEPDRQTMKSFSGTVWTSPQVTSPMTAFTFKVKGYEISGVTFSFFAMCNIILLVVLIVRATETRYVTINPRDLVLHGHNLGAQICSFVSLIRMWCMKRSGRSPVVSLVHFVVFEVVKLFFAGKWISLWPNASSVNWMIAAVAELNTTEPGENKYAEKQAVFMYFTQAYDIEWKAASDPRIPPTWPEGPSQEAFLKWVRSRTYEMKHSVIELGVIATILGAVLSGVGYDDFVRGQDTADVRSFSRDLFSPGDESAMHDHPECRYGALATSDGLV
jgi:hypothetical protein